VFLKWFLFSCISLAWGAPSAQIHKKPSKQKGFPSQIQEIQKIYGSSKTLKAAFSQITTLSHLKQQKKTTGEFFFQKPFSLRWNVKTPFESLTVSDGIHFWAYTPPLDLQDPTDKGQLIQRPASDIRSDLLNALIIGDFSHVKVEAFSSNTLELVPLVSGEKAQFVKALIHFDFSKKRIHQIDLFQATQTIELQFSDVVLGEKLDPSLFVFVDSTKKQ
jgi:outer membrane lipoprotein-sorting protein